MKHIITTPTTVTLFFSLIVASVLTTTINAQHPTPILIYKPPASSSSSDGAVRVEMWLQVLTVCVTNAVMLPAIVISYRKSLYPECVSIGMLFITSMFYHVGETLKVDILGMTHGQWHRLDNIFIICCLQSLFLFLCFSTRVTHMRGYSAWHNQLQQLEQLEQPPQNFTEQLSRLPQASNVNPLTTTTPITSSPVRSPHHHQQPQQPQHQQLQPSQPRRSITPLRVATTNTTTTTTIIAKSSTTTTATTTTRHLVKDELYIERQNSRIELVRWLSNAFVIFCQEKAPWQVPYTVLPILLMATYSFVQLWRTPARYRPRFNRKKLLGGLLFVLLGLIFFVRGLDDDNDYLKMNHGLWHSLAGIGCLCLLSGKQDSVHLTKFLNERRTRIETMDNEEVDSINNDIVVNNSNNSSGGQLEVEHSIGMVNRSNSNSSSSSSSSSSMTSIRVVSPDSSLSSPLSTTTVMTPVSTTSVHSRWRETANANVNSSSNRNNSSSAATTTATTDFEEV